MPELDADYAALRGDAGAVWLPRDVIAATGADALSFLQGQLSQDLAGIELGASAPSFILQPQGKVDALVRVTRAAEDEFLLDVDGGFGPAVIERLGRFKLRVKVDLEPRVWRCLAIRGPRAHEVATPNAEHVLDADWPGWPGADVFGADPAVPVGVRECAIEAYEALRIELGVPVMGRELTDATIPGESGMVERAVSFTKGCFTGQELVARIDSRGGNVPRHLRGVHVAGAVVPPAGAALQVEGRVVGALTSAALSPEQDGVVALAYVQRAVVPPADAVVSWDGGEAAARITALPQSP